MCVGEMAGQAVLLGQVPLPGLSLFASLKELEPYSLAFAPRPFFFDLVVINRRAKQDTVEAGKSEQEGWIELKSGIKPGERVVINPVNLKEGQSVEVRQIHE